MRALTLIDLEDDNVEASGMKERLVTLEDISLFLSGSSISEIKLALCLTMMIQRNVYLLAPVSVK